MFEISLYLYVHNWWIKCLDGQMYILSVHGDPVYPAAQFPGHDPVRLHAACESQ